MLSATAGWIVAALLGAAGVAACLVLRRRYRRLERENGELLTLHTAALDIWDDFSLDVVLQKIVEQASLLVDARYGALAVVGQDGNIASFLTHGISAAGREQIGEPPRGRGLLGLVLHQGQRLRLKDMSHHAGSAGFPPNHPPMRSLLAVPIPCQEPFRGNLYLTEKRGAGEFSKFDEESLVRFASAAALSIDKAHLHHRLNSMAIMDERLRIAHEMHDGIAQVLAYVGTKAQAVREFLKNGRPDEASRHLEQLAAAARDVYGDVRESILGLRTGIGTERPIREALAVYIANWEAQSSIPCHIEIPDELRLAPRIELQVLRVVQEALANVRKHSRAPHATVRIEENSHRIAISVADDGVGFHPGETGRPGFPRFGLTTMRERIESVGGTFQIETEPGAGTRIVCTVPRASG